MSPSTFDCISRATAQAEFLSRTALPEFEHCVVARIRTVRLFAGGVFIDRNDGRAFSQSERLARRNFREPTYKGSGSGFWTYFLAKHCRRSIEHGRSVLQLFATNCDIFVSLAAICNKLQRSATTRQPGSMRIGSKDRVVEHKGIVGRAGVFSLATSARSASSAVGQTSACVQTIVRRRNPGEETRRLGSFSASQGPLRDSGNVAPGPNRRTRRLNRMKPDTDRISTEQPSVSAERTSPKPTGLGMVSSPSIHARRTAPAWRGKAAPALTEHRNLRRR